MKLLEFLVPALREVRAPLVGGYVWLLAAWVAFSDSIPTRGEVQSGTVWHALARLNDEIGVTGRIVGLSVAAYVVGSLVGDAIVKLSDERSGFSASEMIEMGSEFGQVRETVDRVAQLISESDLRLQLSVPVLFLGLAWWGALTVVFVVLAILLLSHGVVLRRRAAVLAARVKTRYDKFVEGSDREAAARKHASIDLDVQRGRIEIKNSGPADASEVDVDVVSANAVIPDRSGLPVFLANGHRQKVQFEVRDERQQTVRLKVSWKDEAGEHAELRVAVV